MSAPTFPGMDAHTFVTPSRLDVEPTGPYVRPGGRLEALHDALRGVELGAYDERIVDWAVAMLDLPTMQVLVCWLQRVRDAGADGAVAAVRALLADEDAVADVVLADEDPRNYDPSVPPMRAVAVSDVERVLDAIRAVRRDEGGERDE